MHGALIIVQTLLTVMLLVLDMCTPASASPKEVELKHDDNESDGNYSSDPIGFLVGAMGSIVLTIKNKLSVPD